MFAEPYSGEGDYIWAHQGLHRGSDIGMYWVLLLLMPPSPPDSLDSGDSMAYDRRGGRSQCQWTQGIPLTGAPEVLSGVSCRNVSSLDPMHPPCSRAQCQHFPVTFQHSHPITPPVISWPQTANIPSDNPSPLIDLKAQAPSSVPGIPPGAECPPGSPSLVPGPGCTVLSASLDLRSSRGQRRSEL